MSSDYPKGPLPIDPKATAEEMIRLFGDEAGRMAFQRAMMFAECENLKASQEWLQVAEYIERITSVIFTHSEAIQ